MREYEPYPEFYSMVDHRQCEILPYYVRLRMLRRDGTETVDLFDTFETAMRWLQGQMDGEEHHVDLQTVTLDCVSGLHGRPEEDWQDDG
ncbi:MAG: hypothetical protein JXB13_08230 [Phycisphaerae bacterium]|nr:hypothetical protein [Phycisphaerae bacterium]